MTVAEIATAIEVTILIATAIENLAIDALEKTTTTTVFFKKKKKH